MTHSSKIAVSLFSLALAAIVGTAFALIQQATGGFVMPMDDPYIHLEIAKNVAESGVPAINPGEIAFATSSYFWTFLLAAAALVGLLSPVTPVLFSGVFAVLTLVISAELLKGVSPRQQVVTLGALVLGTTMPLQVMIGMEHAAHAAAALVAWSLGARVIRDATSRHLVALAVVLAVATLIRFETIFITAPICAGLVWRRNFRGGFAVGIFSILPVSLIGVLSIDQGGKFLPNSVLLRSPMGQVGQASTVDAALHLVKSVFVKLSSAPEVSLMIAMVLAAGVFAWKNRVEKSKLIFPALVVCTAILHIAGAQVGWFFRYQFYLMVGLIVAFSLVIAEILGTERVIQMRQSFSSKDYKLLAVLGVIAGFGVADRTWQTTTAGIQAARENQLQPMQIARFIRDYVLGETVGVHDLGAAVYFTESRVIDLVGLGHNGIADAVFEGRATPEFYQNLVIDEGVTVMFLYPEWMPPNTTSKWSEIAVYSSPRTISEVPLLRVYATHESDVPRLTALLCAFRPTLPAEVTLTISCEKVE